jgi:hypothetical protein
MMHVLREKKGLGVQFVMRVKEAGLAMLRLRRGGIS